MQKIIPNLWFDKESEEAAEFYTSIFKNSKINSKVYYTDAGEEIHGQQAGKLMTIDFEIEGYRIVALNGGPLFKFNPSISFMVRCDSTAEVDEMYTKLSEGGSVLMPLDKYDFSERYAWISDKFGLNWQFFVGEPNAQKIVPSLLFVGEKCGKAEAAMNFYMSIFPDSKENHVSRYDEAAAKNGEKISYASFMLAGQELIVMDSGLEDHKFDFNEAVSLSIEVADQTELDKYWNALSADPQSEQCGWLKDKFGVSWQVVPKGMEEMLNDPDKEKVKRATNAVLAMKKLDIAEIEKAFNGE